MLLPSDIIVWKRPGLSVSDREVATVFPFCLEEKVRLLVSKKKKKKQQFKLFSQAQISNIQRCP